MTLDQVQIRSYFAPPSRSYWRWQDGDKVVAWQDNVTICFRGELERLLACLAPQGLPPLGSVLLLVAACRDSWDQEPNRRTLLHTHLGLLYGGGYSDLLQEVVTGLGQVYQSRQRFRGRLASLATIIFDGAPGRYPPDRSLALVERFCHGLVEDEVEWKAQSPLDDLLHDLGCLRWGLKRFHPDDAALRLDTGLEELPHAAGVEPPPPTSARELIAALQDDPELGAVARLAQLLLAAIHLPRAVSDPDELPVGGVSDIVNRGPIDRLLVSELAHDDLTLAVRVAMNEALYLRPESPPRSPPRSRRVLLDAGLRAWGVPRVFIAAVGLAIAARTDPRLRIETFRSQDGEPAPVDLDSVQGLKAHLAALDHRLHPAEALAKLAERDTEEDAESDLVLVTTDDVPADYDFQRRLQESGPRSLYLATVNRGGQFQLLQKSFRGSKVLCQAQLDLDDVLTPKPKRPRLLDPRRDEPLPAIFRQQPFPLRLAWPVSVARSWLVHPQTVVTFTRDGRLLLWDGPQHGARQVAEGLPDGSLVWCSSAWEDDRVRLVTGKLSQRGLRSVTYNRHTGELQSVVLQLSGNQPRSVIGQAGHAFVFYTDTFDVVSLTTGALLTTSQIPQGMNNSSLFYPRQPAQGEREWWALACVPHFQSTGDQVLFVGGHAHQDFAAREAVEAAQGALVKEFVYRETPQVKLLAMVRPTGCGGPVGITTDRKIVHPETGQVVKPTLHSGTLPPTFSDRGCSLAGVSRDGHRAALLCWSAPRSADSVLLLDLVRGTAQALVRYNPNLLEARIYEHSRPRIMRSRFSAIGVRVDRASRDVHFVLISNRGQRWPLEYHADYQTLSLPKHPQSGDATVGAFARIPFEPLEDFDRGYSLAVARWPDGSRAWLDRRGLLHLKSSDRTIPECSLILNDGPLAGWLEDGRVFGAEYWLDGGTRIPIRVVYDEVLKPFAARVA